MLHHRVAVQQRVEFLLRQHRLDLQPRLRRESLEAFADRHAAGGARKERLGSLLSMAKIEMANLARLMQHSQYGIMLTDWDGVIVSYLGDPGFSATARRSGFREGVIWSERELGTNGMGTCLVTQRPIVIHRRDHFLLQNTQLTCSAAPIAL